MAAEPLPDAVVAVALVAGNALGPARAVNAARALGAEEDDGERLRFVPLARSWPDRQHDAVTVTDQVKFGAETALGAPQRMILWLLQLQRLGSVQQGLRVLLFFSPRRRLDWRG